MTITQYKQFAVWLDTHHAIVVGRTGSGEEFKESGQSSSEGQLANSNENAGNNQAKTALHKFFKAITTHMPNAEEVLVLGPGKAQEQFIHYLAETPQFKNTKATEKAAQKLDVGGVVKEAGEHFGH